MDKDMSFNDNFNSAYCINLDRRMDRWQKSILEFQKVGLVKVSRVSAVDGHKEPPEKIPPGAVGCLKSHLKVFQDAKDREYESFLLLEDDVEFADNFVERFNEVESEIPPYDILYLGGNRIVGRNYPISENVYKVMGVWAAHAVIFKKSVYDEAISRLSGPINKQCDLHYADLQINFRSYMLVPPLAWQRPDYSDIEQGFVDYDFLKR